MLHETYLERHEAPSLLPTAAEPLPGSLETPRDLQTPSFLTPRRPHPRTLSESTLNLSPHGLRGPADRRWETAGQGQAPVASPALGADELSRLRKVVSLQSQEIELLYAEVEGKEAMRKKVQAQHDGLLQAHELVRAQLWRAGEERAKLETSLRAANAELVKLKQRAENGQEECDAVKRAVAERLEKEGRRIREEERRLEEERRRSEREVQDCRRACDEMRREAEGLKKARAEAEARAAAAKAELDRRRREEEEGPRQEEEMRELKEEISRLKIERDALRSKAELAQAMAEKAEAAKAAMEEESARSREEGEEARRRAEDLDVLFASSSGDVKRLLREIGSLGQVGDYLSAIRQEAREASSLLSESLARSKDLQERERKWMDVAEEERRRLEESWAVAEGLRGENGQLRVEVERLREEMDDMTRRRQREMAEVEEVERRCGQEAAERRLRKLKMEVSELEGRVKEAEAGRREAEEDEEKARRTVQRLQEEVRALRGKSREYMEVTTEVLQELQRIKEERTGGEALREELREARGQLEVALSRCEMLERERDDAARRLSLERARCEELERAMQEAAERIVAYEREVDDVKVESQMTANQLEALRRMLGSSVERSDAVAQVLMRTTAHLQRAVVAEADHRASAIAAADAVPLAEARGVGGDDEKQRQVLKSVSPAAARRPRSPPRSTMGGRGVERGREDEDPSPRRAAAALPSPGGGQGASESESGEDTGAEELAEADVSVRSERSNSPTRAKLSGLLRRCQQLKSELQRACVSHRDERRQAGHQAPTRPATIIIPTGPTMATAPPS